MDQYLSDLLKRMGVKESNSNSSESTSFAAHREAEGLQKREYISILIEFISTRNSLKDKLVRKDAYFILGKLLIKYKNYEAVQFMIDQLRVESDKYILCSILDRLADIEKTDSIDITPIIEHIQNDKWLIRYSAICALKKSSSQLARQTAKDIIVECLDLKKFKSEVTYANSVLSDIGTYEEIDVLESLLSSRIRDIKDSAEFAIIKIKERNNIETIIR